jgi:tRNA pseudouridine38-40 synthase
VHRVAVKVAYDGQGFHGSARQPGLATAEGEILLALRRARIVSDVDAARFQIASRTDRGVSALGNVIAFNTSLDPVAAVRALNAKLSRVWAWAALLVPPEFNPRRARGRWYRYDLSPDHDIEKLQTVLSLFQGQHDFRNFTRDRARTVLRIDRATAIRNGDSVALDFRAPSFRWNLVRRLVSAAVRVDSDAVTLGDVGRALEGASRSDLGLAPPEGLTLMDVFFDLGFQRVVDPTTRDRVRQLRSERLRSLRFVEAVAGRLKGSHAAKGAQGISP